MSSPEQPAPTGPAPMAAPVQPTVMQSGLRARAAVQASLAMKILEQCVPLLGAASKEGQEVLECLRKLGKAFGGQPAPGLEQSEVQALGQSVAPLGSPAVTPQQRQSQQQAIQSRFGARPAA